MPLINSMQNSLSVQEGAKLMMKHDWLEEPFQTLDREELAEHKH